MDRSQTDETLEFQITGMTCGGCVASARRALETTPGVDVRQLALGTPTVVRLSGGADQARVREAVEGAGFEAVFHEA
jgi:copper chaperone CopZ